MITLPLKSLFFPLVAGLLCAQPVLAQQTPAGAPRASAVAMDSDTFTAPPVSVKKLSDGALTCQQIETEAQTLQASLAEHQAAAAVAQKAADEARDSMMSEATNMGGSGMQIGSSITSSLLGMIPGGGMLAGVVSEVGVQSAMSARMSGIQESTDKMIQTQQKAVGIQQAAAWSQARQEHLVDMFLRKNCQPTQPTR